MKLLVRLFCIASVSLIAAQDLLNGKGDATFYYDVNGGGTCGPVNGIRSYPAVQGYPLCETNSPDPKQLIVYGTNNIVAIPSALLFTNLDTFCGKKIIVTVNGVERDDLNLVVWDGCVACNKNDGLDFSSTVFADLFGQDKCVESRIQGEMSWRIVDEQIIPYGDQNQGKDYEQKDQENEVEINIELDDNEEDNYVFPHPPEEEEEEVVNVYPPPVEEEIVIPVYSTPEEEEPVYIPYSTPEEEEHVVPVYYAPVEEEQNIILYPTPVEEEPVIPLYSVPEEEEVIYNPGGVLYTLEPEQEEEDHQINYHSQNS